MDKSLTIKGHEVDVSKYLTHELVHVPEWEVMRILKRHSTTSKIQTSVTRNFFREPRILLMGLDQVQDSLVDLIRRLRFKFFARFSELQQKELVKVMHIQYAREGDYLIRKGEVGDNVYFLFLGKAEVILREGDAPSAVLCPGQSFGELALLYDAPRQASIRCQTACAFATLARAPFNAAVAQQRLLEENRVTAHIAGLPPFCAASTRSHNWMAEVIEVVRIKEGHAIDPTELQSMFVMPVHGLFEIRAEIKVAAAEVIRGIVRHRFPIDDAEKIRDTVFEKIPIILLRKGDYFGEDLLLEPDRPIEEVRRWINNVTFSDFYLLARTEGRILTLSKAKFNSLMQKERMLEGHLKTRCKIQCVTRGEQMQKILLLLNRPDYGAKSGQFMKSILSILEDSISRTEKNDVDNFDHKILTKGMEARAKRIKHEKVSKRWEKRETAAYEYIEQKKMISRVSSLPTLHT